MRRVQEQSDQGTEAMSQDADADEAGDTRM